MPYWFNLQRCSWQRRKLVSVCFKHDFIEAFQREQRKEHLESYDMFIMWDFIEIEIEKSWCTAADTDSNVHEHFALRLSETLI